MAVKADHAVDTTGLVCPQPMLAAQRAMKAMRLGEVLELVSTDVGSRMDIPAWCERTGNELVQKFDDGKTFRYLICKRRNAKRK